MGIWVRSQNGELLTEVRIFSFEELYRHKDTGDYYNDIFSSGEKFEKVCSFNGLGIYSSKEKAIKVLDMIQLQLVKGIEAKTKYLPLLKNSEWSSCEHVSKVVFQMPLDEEV